MNILCYDANPAVPGAKINDRFVRWSWRLGAKLLSRFFDKIVPLFSMEEFENLIADSAKSKEEVHIQFWGHGSEGAFVIGDEYGGAWVFKAAPAARNVGLWFRTCNTFSGKTGDTFARSALKKLRYVAGHKTIIHVWQSYLCAYRKASDVKNDVPSHKPGHPFAPRTIFVLRVHLPEWAFKKDK